MLGRRGTVVRTGGRKGRGREGGRAVGELLLKIGRRARAGKLLLNPQRHNELHVKRL